MKTQADIQSGHANGHAANKTSSKPPKKKNLHPKTSVAHWKEVVKKRTSRGTSSPNYSVRIRYEGKRASFQLKTSDKETAARNTRNIYKSILTKGWEATLEEYSPGKRKNTLQIPQSPIKGSTVGDLIQSYMRLSNVQEQTKEAYIKALRRITSEVEGLTVAKRYSGPVHDRWVKSVESVELAQLTPNKIATWRSCYMKQRGADPVTQNQAASTCNALIRNAKSLFAKSILPLIKEEVELPETLPFESLPNLKTGSTRYKSTIVAQDLLNRSEAELKQQDKQVYLIFQLAAVCGLRRGEMDHLLWDAIDLEKGTLTVETTRFHKLKSEDSAGTIDLTDNMIKTLREYAEEKNGIFVIESPFPPVPNSSTRKYRCRGGFKRLIKWLREQGVTAQKPVHELRKEVGSIIAAQHGIHAASLYLRHSTIQITASYYIDKRKRVTPDFGEQ